MQQTRNHRGRRNTVLVKKQQMAAAARSDPLCAFVLRSSNAHIFIKGYDIEMVVLTMMLQMGLNSGVRPIVYHHQPFYLGKASRQQLQ